MNRLSFNISLNNRLRDLSDEDRKDALDYYNELFDEIGLLDNEEVPEKFHNIDKIVKDIKSDMKINRVMEKSKKSGNSLWKNIGIIFLAILATPVALIAILPVFCIFLIFGALLIGLFGGVIALIYAIIAATISLGVFPLGLLGILLIMIGLSIFAFKLISFIVLKIKNFVLRKLNERK